jgi:hypothetical protein
MVSVQTSFDARKVADASSADLSLLLLRRLTTMMWELFTCVAAILISQAKDTIGGMYYVECQK